MPISPSIFHQLAWALIRYRLPVDALGLLFAAPAIMQLWWWMVEARQPGPVPW